MRAYQLISPGVAGIQDVAVPVPGPGEVLVKVAGAGVCHSDLHILHAPAWPMLPMTLGHEISGFVDSVGPGVSGWATGAPVIGYLCWGCGQCRTCAAGYENYCEAYGRAITPGPGLGANGGMAEYVLFPAHYLVPLAERLDPVTAAPLADAALTPWHAVNLARPRLDNAGTAVVIGIGGLGHMTVQILAATTGARIIAVDVDSGRLEQARRLGASDTVVSDEAAAGTILELTKGRGAQAVFDVVGAGSTLALAAGVIAPFGQIVAVGLAGGALSFAADSPPRGLPWGAGIVKPYGGTRAELHDLLALAARGELTVHAEQHPLETAGEVFDLLDTGKVTGRAVLVP